VDPVLLIAQVEHGPQMHGPALLILVGFALVAGLVALVRRAWMRKRSHRDAVSDFDRGPLSRSDRDRGRDPVADHDADPRTPSGGRSG
jgi:hypothetical protein